MSGKLDKIVASQLSAFAKELFYLAKGEDAKHKFSKYSFITK